MASFPEVQGDDWKWSLVVERALSQVVPAPEVSRRSVVVAAVVLSW